MCFENSARRRVEARELRVAEAAETERACEAIRVEPVGPEHLRGAAARGAHQEAHLRQSILRLCETQTEPGVALALRPDVRHAVGIAQDLEFRVEAGHRESPVDDRERAFEGPLGAEVARDEDGDQHEQQTRCAELKPGSLSRGPERRR